MGPESFESVLYGSEAWLKLLTIRMLSYSPLVPTGREGSAPATRMSSSMAWLWKSLSSFVNDFGVGDRAA